MNSPTSPVFTLTRLLVVAALATLPLAACSSSSDEDAILATTSAPSPTSVVSSTPPDNESPGSEPPATIEPDDDTTTTSDLADPAGTTITIPVVTELPPSWSEAFVIPYGPAEDDLGTAAGGDGGSLELGPDYGAQGPDGTWSILDSAKQRIARYDATGRFVDALPLPPEVLVDGVFVQYQMPRVLADGSFVAFGLRPDDTELLVVRDDSVSSRRVGGQWLARVDDGSDLFGFDVDGAPVAFGLDDDTTTPAPWFRTRSGDRYRVDPGPGSLHLELPDAEPPVDRIIELQPPNEIGGTVYPSIEIATGTDGSIHLMILALSDADESRQLGAYLAIGPDGSIAVAEPIRDPFGPSDPGSPSRLGISPGSNTPWLMFVDPDGLRVFHREP